MTSVLPSSHSKAHGKVHPQNGAIEMSALTAIAGVVGRAREAVPAVELVKAQAPVLDFLMTGISDQKCWGLTMKNGGLTLKNAGFHGF